MNPKQLLQAVIVPGLALLPPKMDSLEARAMLLAIALQESGLLHRRQMAGGPARGWWQFESGGVRGVQKHKASATHARNLSMTLCVAEDMAHQALEFCDLLALVFARLLLFTLPGKLCGPDEAMEAWGQYISAWRPGKPHLATWGDNYLEAWKIVLNDTNNLKAFK